ncbi:MAG: manganese efflux pump [Spirochaetales bacterium]|nr:manganese efflux pump [Spirochaetales bacterium]
MSIFEIIIIAFGLSLDAFAVSICKGLSVGKKNIKNSLICGIYFGVFQGVMPLIGYFLGSSFADKISKYDHWIAFILLTIIGLNMIRESLVNETEGNDCCPDFSFKAMLPLAIATSIDALAVGVSFAFLKLNIWFSITAIGIITFVVSVFGAQMGCVLGQKYKKRAELLGGVILIFIGLKILFEHTGILSF